MSYDLVNHLGEVVYSEPYTGEAGLSEYGISWTYDAAKGLVYARDGILGYTTSYQFDVYSGFWQGGVYSEMVQYVKRSLIGNRNRLMHCTMSLLEGNPERIDLLGPYAKYVVLAVTSVAASCEASSRWYGMCRCLESVGSWSEIDHGYDKSAEWVMEHLGKRVTYNQYRMTADISGWKVYTEYELSLVTDILGICEHMIRSNMSNPLNFK